MVTMADRPFREKGAESAAAAAQGQGDGGDDKSDFEKSEFEDKARKENADTKDRFDKLLTDKQLNPKEGKDESADKFVQDKSHKDNKDNKAEKHEKDRKDIFKEKDLVDGVGGTFDPGKGVKSEKQEKDRKDVFKEKDLADGGVVAQQQGVPVPPPGPDPQLLARIESLEAMIGRLMHFIPKESRPDLSRGALQDEPDAEGPSDG
jgi:hypothetical protein